MDSRKAAPLQAGEDRHQGEEGLPEMARQAHRASRAQAAAGDRAVAGVLSPARPRLDVADAASAGRSFIDCARADSLEVVCAVEFGGTTIAIRADGVILHDALSVRDLIQSGRLVSCRILDR